MTDLRTVLHWLDEQDPAPDAECWLLSDRTVLPVVDRAVASGSGSIILITASVWAEPTPVPLRYDALRATIMENYSGAGQMQWSERVNYIYRGSYVVDPMVSVFFTFLPPQVELIETHAEKMEQRRKQARQLTKEIEHSWDT
jgi:hypothetical protein